MTLPECPNFLESKGCVRSDLVIAGETEKFYAFICRTCNLNWMVSKPRQRAEAQYRNAIDRMEKATAADREASRRPSVFGAPKGGWL